MDPGTEFVWKNVTWIVKWDKGIPVFKDKAHLGGRWTPVYPTLDNKSIDSTFKRLLQKAILDHKQIGSKTGSQGLAQER